RRGADAVIRFGAAALLAVGLASPAQAQSVEGYLALARQYAAGRDEDAMKQLAMFARADVEVASAKAALTGSTRDLLAAAMLHTDLANVLVDAKPLDAEFHLDRAR